MLRTSSQDREWPVFPIGPLLLHYGGEEIDDSDGRWRKYKCPFHGERNPSASVNGYEKLFVCHACGVKGNAVQCVMKHEGMSYADALRTTEEITGKSDTPVHEALGRGSRLSGGTRNRGGSRAFRRPWRRS